MKIGIFSILPDVAADPAIVAKHAEDLGFASYWVPDHIILPVTYSTPYPGNPGTGPDPDYLWQMPDPMIALMRAATATSTIEVGTGVLLVQERHPLHLAKEIASVDAYSNGRFHFGIGAGWNKEESEILGGDFEHRWSQVKEAIAVMKACWTQDVAEHQGRYYQFPPVRCYPKPVQQPHPPVYLGGIMFGDEWAKRVFKRIVEWGDGWLPVIRAVSQLTAGIDQLQRLCVEAGRDPASIRITVFGADGQWRKRAQMETLFAAGAGHVTVWLQGRTADDMRHELDALARELFTN